VGDQRSKICFRFHTPLDRPSKPLKPAKAFELFLTSHAIVAATGLDMVECAAQKVERFVVGF
jgi:hypothetical protein